MKKTLTLKVVVQALAWFMATVSPAFSQVPVNTLIQEVGGCAERRGNGTLENDPEPYQPCRNPPTNTLVIRQFGDQTFGFSAEYSQFATTQSSCSVMGVGKRKGNSIVGSVFGFDQKELVEACQIVLRWSGDRYREFQFSESTECPTLCGMNSSVGAIHFSAKATQPFSPSFDCSKALLPTEKAICMDWSLSQVDFRLAELVQEALGTTTNNEIVRQRAWLRSRNACGYDMRCIEENMTARMKSLCRVVDRKIDAKGNC